MSNNSSTEATKPPYLRTSFWSEERNQFWKDSSHTKKSKEYHEKRLISMFKEHRNQATI